MGELPRTAPELQRHPDSRVPLAQVFRGDHEDLVDHLIFASNEHKMRTQPMAGFGRELQPFFTPGEELAPLVPAK